MDSMEKYGLLLENLKKFGKLCVAYSGGTDSTLLLKTAIEALSKENVLAVIADTIFLSREEVEDAKKMAEFLDARCVIVDIGLLHIPQIANNEMNRCYHCKKTIFQDIAKTSINYGIKTIVDGTISDDLSTYRPGLTALSEMGIRSPLKECGLYKHEVREISEKLGLPTWNKATNSCLATRFPCDTEITEKKLETVSKAEDYIKSLGVDGILRCRTHDDVVRIEVERRDFGKVVDNPQVAAELRKLGYRFITLDLEGYRTGSMDDESL